MKKTITTIALIPFLTGCASMKESLITGSAIGATAGGLIGNSHGASGQRNRNTNNGILIGAALGAGISYLAFTDKQKKKRLIQQKAIGKTKDAPLLTRPKVKRIWVEDKIKGKRFIKGHWEYVIQEQSVWSPK